VAGVDSNSKLNEANKFAAPPTAWRKAIYLELHRQLGGTIVMRDRSRSEFPISPAEVSETKKRNATFDVELAR
jgi:hypothetical protein